MLLRRLQMRGMDAWHTPAVLANMVALSKQLAACRKVWHFRP